MRRSLFRSSANAESSSVRVKTLLKKLCDFERARVDVWMIRIGKPSFMKGSNEEIMFTITSSSDISNSKATAFPFILIVRFLAFFNPATLQQHPQFQR
jgi:hypothetical protein